MQFGSPTGILTKEINRKQRKKNISIYFSGWNFVCSFISGRNMGLGAKL